MRAEGSDERHASALKKLRAKSAECKMIASLATDKAKQQLFIKLAQHYNVLASAVARAIGDSEAG